MPNFKFAVRCVRNGQTLYVSNEATLELNPLRVSACLFDTREAALRVCGELLADKRLCVRKASPEKVGLGKGITYDIFN